MVITSAQITAMVGGLLWPLFRISALLMVAPVFGARTVPARIRLGLGVAVTVMVLPLLPAPPGIDIFSLKSFMILAQQVLIGVVMGFALQLVITAVVTGGQIVAMQMGLGFASMVDPQNGTQTAVVSQFYLIVVMLTYLSLGGHLVMFEVLIDSFKTMPISEHGLSPENFWQLVIWGNQIFSGAVGMALPAIASLLMVNFAFGIMTRSAPQMNIFAIGFPLTLLMGFALLLITLPNVVPYSTSLFNDAYHLIRDLTAGAH